MTFGLFTHMKAMLAALLLFAQDAPAQIGAPTQIEVKQGLLRGRKAGDVMTYQGIPYAQPPVGALRWKPPQPPARWDGVLDASSMKPDCMQTPPKTAISEDCLYLNIWRPVTQKTERLPVIVWIHGGSLVSGGSSDYPGHILAGQGVIVVAFNYRLGRFGFFAHPALATEMPDLRGNYGYLDQIAALKWVKENIAHFKGDPDHITVYGDADRGGSAQVLVTAPMARGLFQQAVTEPSVFPFRSIDEAQKEAVAFARSNRIDGAAAKALERLRALPAKKILTGPPPVRPGAILDGILIAETPESVVAAGRAAKLPTITGKMKETDGRIAAFAKGSL